MTIKVIATQKDRDLVIASDKLKREQAKLIERGLEPKAQAPDTVSADEFKKMSSQKFEM